MTALLRLIEQLEGEDSKIARVIGLKKYNSIIKEALQEEKEQIAMEKEQMHAEYMRGWKDGLTKQQEQ
jgi:hypothetical protein